MKPTSCLGSIVDAREVLARASKELGETRTALPLSLLFSSLIASCWPSGTDCGDMVHFQRSFVATDAEFAYYAQDDAVLDSTECLNLCRCLSLQNHPRPTPLEGGTANDAEVSGDGMGDDVDGDPALGDAADAAAHDDAGQDDATTDGGAGGAPGDAGHGGGGTGGGATGGGGNPGRSCPGSYSECAYRGPNAEGGHNVTCGGWYENTCGRNSACHASLGRGMGASAVARWLAFSAATEAASIRSFLTLRRELRSVGAPSDLVRRAHRAAREEARHARWMLRLARDRGGRVEWPRTVQLPLRDLEVIATENAVEGCVYETWAALLNRHQAVHASDAEVRAVMTRVAADETSHAELAHDIDRWAMNALPRAARARVKEAKRAAVRALTNALRDAEPSLQTVLGLPARGRLQFFAEELEKQLWS